MIISYLIQDSVLDQTGFGIYAINDLHQDLGDTTVIIDMSKETIIDDNQNVIVWQDFINAYKNELTLTN